MQQHTTWGTTAFRVAVYGAVVVSALVSLVLYGTHQAGFDWLTGEDHLVEWSQFVLLLAASFTLLAAWWSRRSRNLFTLLLAVLFFLVAGEEISWGERIWADPGALGSVRTRNVQGETNLHNLQGVHGNVRWMGMLFFVVIAIALPLLHRFRPRFLGRWHERLRMPVAPLWVIPIGVVALLFQVVPRALTGRQILGLDQAYLSLQAWRLYEMGEMYSYLVFAILGFHTLRFGPAPVVSEAAPEPDDARTARVQPLTS